MMPQTARTVTGMSVAERAVHRLLIFGTLGLWLPVYWARRHKLERTSVTTFYPPNGSMPGRKS